MPRLLTLLATVAALAVLAGCGGSDNKTSEANTSTSGGASGGGATAPAKTNAAAAAGTVQIAMQDTAFSPKTTTVKVGETVKWTNDDPFDHNVTATKGGDFHSSDFGQGGTYTYKAAKAGTISYVCTLHPGMDGTLKVVK